MAMTGECTKECLLALLEHQAQRIQDSTLRFFITLAQKSKTSSIPRTQYREEIRSSYGFGSTNMANYFVKVKVPIVEPTVNTFGKPAYLFTQNETKRTAPFTSDTADGSYRYWLNTIQNHVWKMSDDLEYSSEPFHQSKNRQQDTTEAKEFQNQGIPKWFQDLLQQRRYDYARSIVDSILTQESGTVELYTLRGDINKSMDSVEASIADYSKALSLQESSEVYMRRGIQYFTSGKRQEAYDDFTSVVRLEPKNYEAVFMRGAAAYNIKRFEEACDDWYLAAQMGHPLADSVLEQRCASVLPKYVRTAITEKKQQIKTALLLLEQIKENVKEHRKLSLNETSYTLDSLSYKSLGIACDMRYILEGGTSTFCMVHLLYTMTLELRDPIASDFVRKLQEKIQSFAASSSTHSTANFDQTMRSIDYNKQIVDVVSNIKNIPNGIDKINSLHSLQVQQQNTMQKSAENNLRNAPSQPSQTIISNLIDQMEKYMLVQYAEILEK
jgi:tetratricopeptide (TPR) repeat protein